MLAPANLSFKGVLDSALRDWSSDCVGGGVLSLAIPVTGIDPLLYLPLLAQNEDFCFLWDSAPGLCLAAAGRCQHLDLSGPRRFELARRFSDSILGRLTDGALVAPAQARPRVLLAFSFFDQCAEHRRSKYSLTGVQAVLPRWQLSRQGHRGWLRLNGLPAERADVRYLAEELWLMAERLRSDLQFSNTIGSSKASGTALNLRSWQDCYRPALNRGIELVNSGNVDKLVLAVQQSIALSSDFSPLPLLARLRRQQSGSCRFLWQRNRSDAFFGASPERLLSLRGGHLRSDALAGTTVRGKHEQNLLCSDKDRREHELVAKAISTLLLKQGLLPSRPKLPRLARHGSLVHLLTPISASTKDQHPLVLAELLHPTPAVAGFPCLEAMSWLQILEPFERGGYAAPIGWIDVNGDAELRVAIRCGHSYESNLCLTAGAGLVRGSIAERELEEVGLKLTVLADQLDLKHADEEGFNANGNFAIT